MFSTYTPNFLTPVYNISFSGPLFFHPSIHLPPPLPLFSPPPPTRSVLEIQSAKPKSRCSGGLPLPSLHNFLPLSRLVTLVSAFPSLFLCISGVSIYSFHSSTDNSPLKHIHTRHFSFFSSLSHCMPEGFSPLFPSSTNSPRCPSNASVLPYLLHISL